MPDLLSFRAKPALSAAEWVEESHATPAALALSRTLQIMHDRVLIIHAHEDHNAGIGCLRTA